MRWSTLDQARSASPRRRWYHRLASIVIGVGLWRRTLGAIREGIAMEPGEMKYGVPNVVYDIIQTVGNLLQGVEKMTEYAGDAEAAGDGDAATVFRTVAEGNRVAAQALLKRLKVHLNDF